MIDPERSYTGDELARIIDEWISEIRDEAIAFEEKLAIRGSDDGLSTEQRAIGALKRPERFRGEHQVARRWLVLYAPHRAVLQKPDGPS